MGGMVTPVVATKVPTHFQWPARQHWPLFQDVIDVNLIEAPRRGFPDNYDQDRGDVQKVKHDNVGSIWRQCSACDAADLSSSEIQRVKRSGRCEDCSLEKNKGGASLNLIPHCDEPNLEEWLLKVDSSGNLTQYLLSLQASCGSLGEVVMRYVRKGSDERPELDPSFFAEHSVEKIAHRRLFERWFTTPAVIRRGEFRRLSVTLRSKK